MIAVLDRNASVRMKAEIVRFLEQEGFRVQVSETAEGALVSVVGEGATALADRLRAMPGISELRPDAPAYPLVSRTHRPDDTRVKVDDVVIGGRELVVMAGPCSVESRDQILAAAEAVVAAGARLLRGGAFKPRSSPYSFQGLGAEGLDLLAEARERTGLRVVTEVVAPEDVELVSARADVLQIGARNMHNYRLLSAVGGQPRPVLLKRGMMSTLDEMLHAAEYVVAAGNPRVVLCERGIRTFETSSRNTLDVCAVPVLKERTHLPIIVDPSHAAGRREWVPALARAAVAAGADGLLVEVHPEPERAASDGRQSLTPDAFQTMMADLVRVARAVDRTLDRAAAEE
jgi:3-deoxy-7-phosphoheptulonate synthase